jgi:hypothetical protein
VKGLDSGYCGFKNSGVSFWLDYPCVFEIVRKELSAAKQAILIIRSFIRKTSHPETTYVEVSSTALTPTAIMTTMTSGINLEYRSRKDEA